MQGSGFNSLNYHNQNKRQNFPTCQSGTADENISSFNTEDVILHHSTNEPCRQAHVHASAKRGRGPPRPLLQKKISEHHYGFQIRTGPISKLPALCFFLKVSRPKPVPYYMTREEKREQFWFSGQEKASPALTHLTVF